MRVIVTGASGLLGRAVYKTFREAGHEDKLESLIQELKPDVIINTAAERRPDVAEKNREATFELNVNVPAHIASLSKVYNVLLVHISTDYVFDGKNPPYDVNDKPNPLNFYGNSFKTILILFSLTITMNNHSTSGETKYKSELAIRSANQQAVILRVPILYGEVEFPGESAVNILVDSVKNSSKNVEMDHYAIRYPTNVQDVARVIKDISEKHVDQHIPISGILHFSGNENFTKYKMCEIFSKVLQVPINHIKPIDHIPAAAA
ncbi:16939_t:CDS:2, partial [Dentiscutata erythropus]